MRPAPPLSVWVGGAALAALAIGFAFVRHYQNLAQGADAQRITAAFARTVLRAPRQPGEIRVLGLGTSLLWAASPPEPFDPQRLHPRLNWMRLTKSGAGLGILAGSLAEIEQAPPTILVIEKGLLFVAEGDSINDSVKFEVKHAVKHVLFTLAGVDSQSRSLQIEAQLPLAEQRMALPCTRDSRPLRPAEREAHAQVMRHAYAEVAPNQVLTRRLLALARRGVHVAIVDIPRSAELERETAGAKQAWYARLRQALQPGPTLSYHHAPSFAGQTLYCDGAHLNAAGSRLFGAWWLAELATIRTGGP